MATMPNLDEGGEENGRTAPCKSTGISTTWPLQQPFSTPDRRRLDWLVFSRRFMVTQTPSTHRRMDWGKEGKGQYDHGGLEAGTSPGIDVPVADTARPVITAPKEPENKGRVYVVATQLRSSGVQ